MSYSRSFAPLVACGSILAACAHAPTPASSAPPRARTETGQAAIAAEDEPSMPEIGPALMPAHVSQLGPIGGIAFAPGDRALLVQAGETIAVLDPRSGEVRNVLPDARWSAAFGTRLLTRLGIWDWAADRVVPLRRRNAEVSTESSDGRWVFHSYHRFVPDERADLIVIDLGEATERELTSARNIHSLTVAANDARLLVAASPESQLLSLPSGEILARFEGPRARAGDEHFAVLTENEVSVRRLLDGGLVWTQRLPDEIAGRGSIESIDGGRVVVSAYNRGAYAWDTSTGRALGIHQPVRSPEPPRVEPAGVRFELTGDCRLMRRTAERAEAIRVAPPLLAEAVEADEEQDPYCDMVRSADGSIVAFARPEGVYLFDGRSGAPIQTPTPAIALACDLTRATSFNEGLGVLRPSEWSVDLAGCAPRSTRRGDGEAGAWLGDSANGRFAIVARVEEHRREPDDEDDEEEGSSVDAALSLVELGTNGIESTVALGERASCFEDNGYSEGEGWVPRLECATQAAVSDDGRTVFLGDQSGVRVVDVRRRRTRRISFERHHTSLEILGPRFVLSFDELVDVTSGARRSSSEVPSFDLARRRVLMSGQGEITVVELATGQARTFPIEAGERWVISRDGTAVIRFAPPAPVVTVDVATGERTTSPLPDGFRPSPISSSADGRQMLGCVDGELTIATRGPAPQQHRVEGVACTEDSAPSYVSEDRAAILVRPTGHTLVRLSDGVSLELVPLGLHPGATAAWARDGRFFVRPALLPLLRVREPGRVLDAPASAAEGSPRYAADLVRELLAPPSN